MTGSALWGKPPNSERDYQIVRGLLFSYGFPSSTDPGLGVPTNQHAPPNYRFETRGPGVIGGLVVAILLSFLITGTRLLLRGCCKDLRWGLDDWVIIPAALGTMSWMGCQIAMVTHGGVGKHIWDVSYEELYWFFRLAGISEVIFYCTLGMIKISITLFNRRLTSLTSRRWMMAHYTFLFLLVCYIVITLFLEIFKCRPAASHYSLMRIGQVENSVKCLPFYVLGIGLSSVHVAFDFALLSVPLIILYKIKMDLSKKIRLAFLFSVGSVSCMASAMRHHVQYQAILRPDLTWTFPKRAPWTLVDIFFALVAASLPVLNAITQKRWRSPSSSPRSSTPVGAAPFGVASHGVFHRSGSDTETHDLNRYLGRPREKDYLDESGDFSRSDSIYSTKPPAPWVELGQDVTMAVPTHREKIKNSSRRGSD